MEMFIWLYDLVSREMLHMKSMTGLYTVWNDFIKAGEPRVLFDSLQYLILFSLNQYQLKILQFYLKSLRLKHCNAS